MGKRISKFPLWILYSPVLNMFSDMFPSGNNNNIPLNLIEEADVHRIAALIHIFLWSNATL